MGIRIHFLDGDEPRDVKDIRAALLIQETLRVLEISFKQIMITQTDEENDIVGIDKEDWM